MQTIFNTLQYLSNQLTAEDIPSWVKSASINDLDVGSDPRVALAFADSDAQLPIHTKVATFISSVAFELTPESQGIHQSLVRSKLASARRDFGIDDADVQKAVKTVRTNERVQTPAQVSADLAKMANSPTSGEQLKLSELVRAARELKASGVNDHFTASWSFTEPRQGIKAAMLEVAMNHGNDRAKEIAKLAQSMTHENAQMQLVELLDNVSLDGTTLTSLHSKFAKLPELGEFDCRICGCDYPDATIRPKLAAISRRTGQQLVGRFLNANPTPGYRKQLEDAPRDVQRLVQSCL